MLVGVADATCYNCGRRNPGLWGFAPVLRALGNDLGFTPFIVGTCAVMYVLSLLLSGGRLGPMLSPSSTALFALGDSGGFPLFSIGRWWTVLSAGWLHGSLLHIAFNMYAVWQLVPGIAELYGAGRTVIIYTAGAVVGFFLSSAIGYFVPGMPLFGSSFTVGASASVFGLLGAVVYYGRRTGSRAASSQAWYYAIAMGGMGLFMQGVDNAAHVGGFLGGYLAGRLLDPLTQERVDHMLIAVGCIALSMISILVSAYSSLAIFR